MFKTRPVAATSAATGLPRALLGLTPAVLLGCRPATALHANSGSNPHFEILSKSSIFAEFEIRGSCLCFAPVRPLHGRPSHVISTSCGERQPGYAALSDCQLRFQIDATRVCIYMQNKLHAKPCFTRQVMSQRLRQNSPASHGNGSAKALFVPS